MLRHPLGVVWSQPGVAQALAFPPEFLDEIRARVPLVTMVGRRVPLRKKGREHEGLCPFHQEKTPSFTVSEAKGFYHCFGCGAHGDVISFVMNTEGLGFPETVERLAGEAGLTLPETTPEARAEAKRRASSLEVVEAAAAWFEAELAGSGGGEARSYLAGRGLSPETVRRFRLGFAPGQRGRLRAALNAKGIEDRQMIEAGLMKADEAGGEPRDYFFNRVIIPITDRRDRVIAFGGRALGESKAKYLNSPENPLFHKGRVLYNLAGARQAAHDTGELVVAEGYMDVIALSAAGYPAAVAPLGTAITADQLTLLWRMAPEPILALDGDQAGRRAALRAAAVALPKLAPGRSLRFALLPKGEDPDSLVKGSGLGAFRAVLDRALTLDALLWLGESEGRRLDAPERQAGLWQALKSLIAKIEDPTVQAAYQEAMVRRFEAAFGYNPFSGRRAYNRAYKKTGKKGAFSGRLEAPSHLSGRLSVGRGLRPDMGTLRRRREEVILAAVVNHPFLLLDYAEDIAGLTFHSPDLASFAIRLLDAFAAMPDLDREGLKCHLSEQGQAKVLAGLLRPQVYAHGGFARPDSEAEDVRDSWRHFVALHHEAAAEAETAEAARLLAEDPSEERLARLQAQQRAEHGGESKRVQFDYSEAEDAG